MAGKVIAFRLTDRDALRLLAKIATDSNRIVFTDHALAQMRKRRISPLQVINCLRKGAVTESPCLDFKGFWKLTIERFVAGEAIGCGVSIDMSTPKAIVITAFWVK